MPAMPIAESKPPMVVGIRQTKQRDEDEDRLRRVGVDCEGLQRRDGQQEDDGESRKQNAQRDFVWGLLALGAFD